VFDIDDKPLTYQEEVEEKLGNLYQEMRDKFKDAKTVNTEVTTLDGDQNSSSNKTNSRNSSDSEKTTHIPPTGNIDQNNPGEGIHPNENHNFRARDFIIPNANNGPGFFQRVGNFFMGLPIPGLSYLFESAKHKEGRAHPFIERLKEAAYENNTESAEYFFILGSVYLEGSTDYDVEQNTTLALEYFDQAAMRGHLESMSLAGSFYLLEDKNKAFKYLKTWAEADLPSCHLVLSTLYADFLFEKSDEDKAIEHLKKILDHDEYRSMANRKLRDIYRNKFWGPDYTNINYYFDYYLNNTENVEVYAEDLSDKIDK